MKFSSGIVAMSSSGGAVLGGSIGGPLGALIGAAVGVTIGLIAGDEEGQAPKKRPRLSDKYSLKVTVHSPARKGFVRGDNDRTAPSYEGNSEYAK